jgi:hypothetical protein
MTDSEHDDEFEAYLKRGRRIHKGATPPDRLEPPPELDRIIIGNARKAIQGAAPLRLYRAPKWALPVGLAATIVISFAVVLELGLRAKHAAPVEESMETDLVAEAPTVDGVPAPGLATPAAPVMEDKSGAKPAGSGTSTGHRVVPKAAKRIKLPAIPTTPWPPATTRNTGPSVAADAAGQVEADKARARFARAEVAASRSRSDAELSEGAPAETSAGSNAEARSTAPATSNAAAHEAYAAVEKPAAKDGPGISVEGAGESTVGPSTGATGAGESTVGPSTGATGAGESTVAPGIRAMGAGASTVGPGTRAMGAGASTVGPGIRAMGPGTSATSPVDEVVVTRKGAAPKARDPVPASSAHPAREVWLSQIEKLRGAGQMAEAERQIKLFREAYPAYPVPKAVADAAGPADGRAQ